MEGAKNEDFSLTGSYMRGFTVFETFALAGMCFKFETETSLKPEPDFLSAENFEIMVKIKLNK